MFKSVDGGETWMEKDEGVEEDEGITFRGFAIDPLDSNVVYAAARSLPGKWAGQERPGREFDLTTGVVYKTTDGGRALVGRLAWRQPGPLHLDRPRDPRWSTSRPASSTGRRPTPTRRCQHPVARASSRARTAARPGRTSTAGLQNLYVGTLFMHPADPRLLLAGTGNNQYHEGAGVYLSVDGAASLAAHAARRHHQSVEFAVSDRMVAYAAGADRRLPERDGGQTWRSRPRRRGRVGPARACGRVSPSICRSTPAIPDRVFANNYGGGNFLEDGGRTLDGGQPGYTGAQVRDIAVDPSQPGRVWRQPAAEFSPA